MMRPSSTVGHRVHMRDVLAKSVKYAPVRLLPCNGRDVMVLFLLRPRRRNDGQILRVLDREHPTAVSPRSQGQWNAGFRSHFVHANAGQPAGRNECVGPSARYAYRLWTESQYEHLDGNPDSGEYG